MRGQNILNCRKGFFMQRDKILIVDDEHEIADLVSLYLENEDFQVFKFYNAMDALRCIETEKLDLAVLDVMLPDMDGFQLCQKIREQHQYPVIMLTARGEGIDKINGLSIGADDYMTKPVNLDEMVLRVRALLRRSHIASNKRLTLPHTILDYDALTVTWGDDPQMLPQKEFFLLFKLISYPNKIFTRMQLMDEIWGRNSESDLQTIDVHINRLRRRFENNPDFEIITVRGLGYKAVMKE